MKIAVNAFHRAVASKDFKRLEQARADARRNEASALRHARDDEAAKWKKKLELKDKKLELKDKKLELKDKEIARLRKLLEQK